VLPRRPPSPRSWRRSPPGPARRARTRTHRPRGTRRRPRMTKARRPRCWNLYVHLNTYGADSGHLAADLANPRPRPTRELVDRCREAGVTIDRAASDADLAEVGDFLDAWLVVVDTPAPHGRADALNPLLAEHSAPPRLTDHDGHWHVHYRADDVSFARLLTAMFSVGTALHLTSRGIDRLARCAADDCDAVFADTTRNGRRTYCSTRCTKDRKSVV